MRRIGLLILTLAIANAIMGQRVMEELDRGLVAIQRSGGVYLGWRVLGEEWVDVSYAIYRNGSKIHETSENDPSNYLDTEGSAGDIYRIAAIRGEIEGDLSKEVSVRSNAYYDIPINRPPNGTCPDGSYSYYANDASAADLDGDGELEIILKWDPSNSKDNSHSGYTGNVIIDAYKMNGTHMWRIDLGRNIRAGAHYTQFLVYDFDGDGKAEIACKTADGTKDNAGTIIGNVDADYRNSSGRVLSGPEFLTVFNGETGEIMQTIDFQPARGSVSAWGDTYGNRVDRFLAGTPYLDGEHASILMCRGYYAKTMLAAYDWKDNQLTMRWLFNADGSNNSSYRGQGNHNLSIADVDNDGKDEIIYGSMTIDDDGTGLYSTGLHHGDALHVSDMDPDHPGIEVYQPHEDGVNGVTFREAATGKILWQHKSGDDVGRGIAADVIASSRGFESWASSGLGMYDANGDYLSGMPNSINFRIFWDKDLSSELLDGTSIRDFSTVLLNPDYVSSNNGTKSTPSLSADLFGDWREEVIWPYGNEERLRIFTTIDLTSYKLYTLLHDSQYRSAIAWQNVAYNQPPHQSFYMEADMALPVPQVFSGLKWLGNSGQNTWNTTSNNFEDENGDLSSFSNGDTVIFSFDGEHATSVNITEVLTPGLLVFASPDDYILEGNGSLSGVMNLYKSQKGSLKMNGSYSYSGKTIVSDGALIVNGTLEQTTAYVSGGTWGGENSSPELGGRLGGSGKISAGAIIQNRGALLPGMQSVDTIAFGSMLKIENRALVYFDLSSSTTGENDFIKIDGDLVLDPDVLFSFNLYEASIDTGKYELFSFTGNFSGNLESIGIVGLDGYVVDLIIENNKLILHRPALRAAKTLTWTGNTNMLWGITGDMNWSDVSTEDYFLPMDIAILDNTGADNPEIELIGEVAMADLIVSGEVDYTISGDGKLSGQGGLSKSGDGTLAILTTNSFGGATELNGGTIIVNQLRNGDQESNLGQAGSEPEALLVNGGTLQIQGNGVSDKSLQIGAAGATLEIIQSQELNGDIEGNGSLRKSGEGTLYISGENSFSGDFIIEEGIVNLRDDPANLGGLGTGTIHMLGGALQFYENRNTYNHTYYKIHVPENAYGILYMDPRVYSWDSLSGNGELDIYIDYTRTEFKGNWSEYKGTLNFYGDADGGDFRINNDYGYANSTITLNDRVYAYHIEGDTISIGCLSTMDNTTMGNAKWKIGGIGAVSQLSGKITDGELIKVGPGRLIIDGNENSYTGQTSIMEGTLELANSDGSATGSGNVIVKNQAVLSGDGITQSDVFIEGGGYLSPGKEIGTLTVESSITLQEGSILFTELNNEIASNDLLIADSIVLESPNLLMINNSAIGYKKGDRYKIFEANDVSGHFKNIYPKSPSDGLQWDTTNLYTFGMIEITEIDTSNNNNNNGGVSTMEHMQTTAAIYPNPGNGIFYIEMNDNNNDDLRVVDSSGKIISDCHIRNNPKQSIVNLTGMPEGSYFLKIGKGSNTITKKLIVVHN